MPRPSTRRRVVAAVLASVAMLSACTGNADDGSDGTGASETPAVAPTAAGTTATAAVTDAVAALSNTSSTGAAARAKAFVGPALESANAYSEMLPGRTAAEKADTELSTTGVKVLAISREGDKPVQILAQTTLKKTGAAVLVLLVADSPEGPFRAAAVTPMLPGAELDALDAVGDGSAAVADAKGLAAKPEDVVASFAEAVKYPDPVDSTLLADDPLTEQLRQSARAQSQALNNQGAFTQKHEPKDVIGGLRLKDGSGALVFAHLVRHDAIAMRTPVKLTPSKELTLLTGIKQITTEADLTSNEIIAIVIPATGKARVVASSDQLVDGTGR
jgi:hypothetical protein